MDQSGMQHSPLSSTSRPRRNAARRRRVNRDKKFNVYIYRVLKAMHQDIGITKKGMDVMNSFVLDMFERFANEASRLVRMRNRKTLKLRDFITASKLILEGELGNFAHSEGLLAITKYRYSYR
uniref:Histone domain-containing protein n=1 Tax=Parastrongyloides trichosuri TaxID=131310 RepID=A0A0N4ZEA7_PARTI